MSLELEAASARRVGGMTMLERQIASRIYKLGQGARSAALARIAARSTTNLLSLAEDLRVDPRWLLKGTWSPAGRAAFAQLRLSADGVRALENVQIGGALLAEAIAWVRQPPIDHQICRYCGCTEHRNCGSGCRWIDHDETICSRCVEVPGGD